MGDLKGERSTCNLINYRSCWYEDVRVDSMIRGRLTFLLVHTRLYTVLFVMCSTFLNIVSVSSVLCYLGAAIGLSKALLRPRKSFTYEYYLK